jgi:hypothetical protein
VHKLSYRLIRAGAVLILALAGFFVFVRTPHVDRKLLRNLVIDHTATPGVAGRRPAISEPVPSSTSSFPAVKAASKSDPDNVGIYETEWYLTASTPPDAGILLTYLPNESAARETLTDAVKLLSKPPTLQGESATTPQRFSVTSVGGAHAVYSKLTTSAGNAAGYSYSLDFRVGRVVVSELIITKQSSLDTSAAETDAREEATLLERAEAGFTLSSVSTPVTASIVYWVVALVLVAGAFALPELAAAQVQRRHERREQRDNERSRSQYLARGRRAVQRHKAPAWRQSSRR